MLSLKNLQQILREKLSISKDSKLVVAYSGGLDSHVLLHMLASLRTIYPFELSAIHVNHRLLSYADECEAHCQKICDKLTVALTIVRLDLHRQPGESLEAVAREARYQALAEHLPANSICLTAQHQNDQAETLLLQLLRGAGVHGIAAMPASKPFSSGKLMRPLLGFSRESLETYAAEHELSWVEDPSNQDTQFDRNFLRNEVLPLLKTRWPGLDKSLARSASHAGSAMLLLDEMAMLDLKQCDLRSTHLFPSSLGCLNSVSLAKLPSSHRINALRHWLRVEGVQVPAEASMQSLDDLLDQSIGRGSVSWKHGVFRLENGLLWLCDSTDISRFSVQNESALYWNAELALSLSRQTLIAKRVIEEGVSISYLDGSDLQVKFRTGGEQCQMSGDHGRKSLTKLFQDVSIPNWARDSVPLLYIEGELVAVSSFWSNPHYLPEIDAEGLVFSVEFEV